MNGMTFIPSRYPYTYAADYVRSLATKTDDQYGVEVTLFSRGDASKIQKGIAQAMGVEIHELVFKMAAAYMKKWKIEIDGGARRHMALRRRQIRATFGKRLGRG